MVETDLIAIDLVKRKDGTDRKQVILRDIGRRELALIEQEFDSNPLQVPN